MHFACSPITWRPCCRRWRTKLRGCSTWKYFILCGVGIAQALFGTILLYFASEKLLGAGGGALLWTELDDVKGHLEPTVLSIAFVFLLVGYGTKVGLVPLHNWLPDAHAEGPTPVSAVLSGLLLNVALYAVVRCKVLVDGALPEAFAKNMGAALENARLFDETQRLLKETEQRNAELAVINSIQQGVASELDFQKIIEVAGDKLREVLKTDEIGVRWLDHDARRVHYLYEYEHGVRLAIPPQECDEASWTRMVSRRGPRISNTAAEAAALGVLPGTDTSKSSVSVQIAAGERVLGAIAVEDYEREYAFTASDIRLLETVASGMGVALENARLFHETQRLLKETEQQNAELAVINSVQQGLAAELDFQSIIDLVGDKIAEIFNAKDMAIALHDRTSGIVSMPYYLEHGQRFEVASRPSGGVGLTAEVIRSRRPLLINRDFQKRSSELGSITIGDPTAPLLTGSYLGAPILKGDDALGVIALYSKDTDAYGDSEVRLLTTLANALSVALENARLFDEAQRRTRETAVLAEVGRDISSTLDLAKVLDRIARHAMELLHGDNSAIFLPQPDGKSYRAIVAIGTVAPQILAMDVEAGRGIIGSLLAAGRAEFVNDTRSDSRGLQIAGTEETADERMMVAPLFVGDEVRGGMAVWRTGGRTFDQAELEFLVGLSQQAAVAIENARLFDETRLTLERQTATAEVLQVISGSVSDPKPVFDKILDSCQRLFGATDLAVFLTEDEQLQIAAQRGGFPGAVAGIASNYPRPLAGTVSEEALRQGTVLHRGSVVGDAGVPDYLRHGLLTRANASCPSASARRISRARSVCANRSSGSSTPACA